MQNLLETLMNSGIPVKKHLYKKVILSNRMWPITNYQKLPFSSFLDKNHLTG
jgi:hypothetical protein